MLFRSGADREAKVRERLQAALPTIAFMVVPSAAALLILGDVLAGAVLQSGAFQRADTLWVWAVLAGSSVGLLAGTLGRLYNSAWYALHDTRTPVKMALLRIVVAAALGATLALNGPRWLGLEARWGVAGLTLSAGCAAWIEYTLLRRSLNRRIGETGLARGYLPRLWTGALVAAALAWGVKAVIATWNPVALAAVVFPVFGVAYLGIAHAMRIPEAQVVLARLGRRFGMGTPR